MPVLNPPNEGVIASNTLNLTRLTAMVGGALVAVTASGGIGATEEDPGWTGFDLDQRLVILVAIIGAVAIVHAVDLLARSIATSRAVSAGTIPLPLAVAAELSATATNLPVSQQPGKPPAHFDGRVVSL